MVIRINKSNLLECAIILNTAYASYSTLCYSILGESGILRTTLIVILMVLNIYAICKNAKGFNILLTILAIICILFGGTYFFFSKNRLFISGNIVDVIKFSILAYFIAISPPEILHSGLKKAAYMILFCGLFEPFTLYVTGEHDGYMVYGMRILLATVLLEYCYFREKRKFHLFAAFVSVILILLYGNRSSILNTLICLIIFYLIFGERKHRAIQYISITVLIIITVFLLAGDVLTMLSSTLETMGISSRTLTLMVSGLEIATDNNGRSIIWGNCQKAISESPWFGYGIGGDRNLFLLGSNYIHSGGGVYAHNFFYELLIDFGIIIGTILLIIIFYVCFKTILNKFDTPCKKLFIGLFAVTVIKLWVSSSIWTDMNTYLCLGVILNEFRYRKRIKKLNALPINFEGDYPFENFSFKVY